METFNNTEADTNATNSNDETTTAEALINETLVSDELISEALVNETLSNEETSTRHNSIANSASDPNRATDAAVRDSITTEKTPLTRAEQPRSEATLNAKDTTIPEVKNIALSKLLGDTIINQSAFEPLVIDTSAIDEYREHELWKKIDLVDNPTPKQVNQYEETEIESEIIIGSSIGIAAGMAGWALRSGAFLTSLMSTVPVFASFDPLPVLKGGNHLPHNSNSSGANDNHQNNRHDKNKIHLKR